jgi:hypothetical protein
MPQNRVTTKSKCLGRLAGIALLTIGAAIALPAQTGGPMQPPESTKFPTPPTPAKPEPPTLAPDEIIRRFAAREDEMVRAIRGYTFQKDLRIQEIGPDGKASGQIEVVTQLRFSPEGKLFEKPVGRPASTLHYLNLQRGDSDLVVPTPMFPLTSATLAKYEIAYGGKQPLDELSAYYFTVKPRALERAHAYFSGVVWVDVQDFVIVKTMGKWVTELGDVTASDLPFTVFETYRQQVGKDFWFPSYARSDDTAQVGDVSVPVRAIVKWTDFRPADSAPSADAPPVMKPPANADDGSNGAGKP